MLYALTNRVNVKDSVLYTMLSPCLPCACIMFGVGIKKVIYKVAYTAYKNLDYEEGLNFLHEFGVMVAHYDPYRYTDL